MDQFLGTIADLANTSGLAGFFVEGGWKNLVMILISFLFMYHFGITIATYIQIIQ